MAAGLLPRHGMPVIRVGTMRIQADGIDCRL